MVICRELSKLSKPISIKSVNFRNAVPGSPDALLTPASSLSSYLPRNLLVDPTHPAAFLPRYAYKTFPSFRSNILGIQAYPKALLTRPEVEWPDPPFKLVKHVPWQEWVGNNVVDGRSNGDSRDGNDGDDGLAMPMKLKTGSIDMAMLSVLGKKVHKKAVIRNRIISRLKTGISLLVVRGADAKDVNGKSRLIFNNDRGKQWILPDWVYIFFPKIEVYRLPYSELVRTLRQALGTIYDSGLSMELSWREFAKEQSLSIKERTDAVTKRYKQTHASRPQKPNVPSVNGQYTRVPKSNRFPDTVPRTPATQSLTNLKSGMAVDAYEKPKLTPSEKLPFGLRKPPPKPSRTDPYPGEIDANPAQHAKTDVVVKTKTSLAWTEGDIVPDIDNVERPSSPTSGEPTNDPLALGHGTEDLKNDLGIPNTEIPKVKTAYIPELPKPPMDTFSLFDAPPLKPSSLTPIMSKLKMDKDTQDLNPERPWASFDFGFDTVLREERDTKCSDESTSPTTASSRQVPELFFPPTPTPESVPSTAYFPRGSRRQKSLRSPLPPLDMLKTSNRSIGHRSRHRTRPHPIHVGGDQSNISERFGREGKSKPNVKPRRPGITLFQKKPIFIPHPCRVKKE